MKFLGDLESDVLRDRLAAIAIDRPVFITCIARSGTTLLHRSALPRASVLFA